MIWLARDFDLLSVVLRAAFLAFQTLVVGGIAYLLVIHTRSTADVTRSCRHMIGVMAVGLVTTAALSAAVTAATLKSTSGLSLNQLAGAGYFLADAFLFACGIAVWILVRFEFSEGERWNTYALVALAFLIVSASVGTSHAISRMDNRWKLCALTAGHDVGVALWVGTMPFLLLALKRVRNEDEAKRLLSQYSTLAIAGVALLIAAGAGLAWFYLGFGGMHPSSPASAIYGTAYGVMLLAKVYVVLIMLLLGAVNFMIKGAVGSEPKEHSVRLLMRLRRFSEVEIGLGFTAIILAASLTSQPPAVDFIADRLSIQDITARFRVKLPSMRSPSLAQLALPDSMESAVQRNEFRGVSVSDAEDRAWSEYNHHWAGLIVLVAGTLALLGRRMRGARHWPLAFAGLAVFILLRADPENWPLGPRPFWASFSQPDVLQHRLYAVIILAFAAFEWGIAIGRWGSSMTIRPADSEAPWAAWLFPLAFPSMCAIGGALMLLHSHALGNVKQELLAEMSHTTIALLGITAGWARWLELRLPSIPPPASKGPTGIAPFVWPLCLVLAGLVLLNYRES